MLMRTFLVFLLASSIRGNETLSDQGKFLTEFNRVEKLLTMPNATQCIVGRELRHLYHAGESLSGLGWIVFKPDVLEIARSFIDRFGAEAKVEIDFPELENYQPPPSDPKDNGFVSIIVSLLRAHWSTFVVLLLISAFSLLFYCVARRYYFLRAHRSCKLIPPVDTKLSA